MEPAGPCRARGGNRESSAGAAGPGEAQGEAHGDEGGSDGDGEIPPPVLGVCRAVQEAGGGMLSDFPPGWAGFQGYFVLSCSTIQAREGRERERGKLASFSLRCSK